MVDLAELKGIAEAAARRGLAPTPVEEVRIEDAIGENGEDLLRVIIVIPDDRFDEVDGTHLLRGLRHVRDDMRSAGESREAVVQFDTPSGLTEDDDD